MGKFTAFFLSFIVIPLGSLWAATQRIAEIMEYNAHFLGKPFIGHYYLPWRYFQWKALYGPIVPKIFSSVSIYFPVAFFLSMALLYFTSHTKDMTSHGSARWAEYRDLLKLDLISGSGVVVGLYDSPLKRAFTSFLRSVELVKKEKKAFAELSFERRKAFQMDKNVQKIARLKEEIADSDDPKRKESLQKKIGMLEAENNRKYDPLDEWDFFVWFLDFSYKILFGLYKKMSHFYLRDNSNKHLAVIAPTRSGKGVGLIIPTLLGGWKSSTIVNDIKSENWAVTSGYRKKKMRQVTIKFEPTAEDGSTARWNPLDEIPIGTPMEVSMAQNLAAIIADYEGKGKPDHWTANAAMVISAVILHLKYAHCVDPEHYPHPSLFTVASYMKTNVIPQIDDDGRPIECTDEGDDVDASDPSTWRSAGFVDTLKFLTNPDSPFEHVPKEGIKIREWDTQKQAYVERKFTQEDLHNLYPGQESLKEHPGIHPIIYQSFKEIVAKPPNEGGSIISTANTALKEYLDPVLAANTSVSDFCVDDLMNYKKPVSLYLVTPPSDLLRLAPIFRLFFEMMVRHHARVMGFEHARPVDKYKHKCLFLMDEFSSLGNLQSFAATLSYIAGYGMKVFLINQGLPQINGIYGKDNQILMNCHLQIFYAPNDNDTGKYCESLLGNKTIETESVSSDGGLFGKKNYSRSQTGRALMTADEIKRLGDKEIIVASGFPPVLTDKVKYYENKYFTDKLLDPPVASDVIRHNPYPRRVRLLLEHDDLADFTDDEMRSVDTGEILPDLAQKVAEARDKARGGRRKAQEPPAKEAPQAEESPKKDRYALKDFGSITLHSKKGSRDHIDKKET